MILLTINKSCQVMLIRRFIWFLNAQFPKMFKPMMNSLKETCAIEKKYKTIIVRNWVENAHLSYFEKRTDVSEMIL